VVLAAVLLLTPSIGRAQVFGQLTSAKPLEVNSRMFGGYLQFSENTLSLLGQLRLSFYPGVDFGFQGGLARQDFGDDDRTTLTLGGDIKYQIGTQDTGSPVATSLGASIGVQTGDDYSILSLGPTLVGSRTLMTGQSVSLTPYVGVGLLFSNINVGDNNDTDFAFPLRFGTTLRLNQSVDLVGEIQFRIGDDFDDDMSTTLGINAPF
jgi:hypothetical protein